METIVVDRINGEKYRVYDISYDNSGLPHFLIYKDNQWQRLSAKHFRPWSEEDWNKMLEPFFKYCGE